jgi:hypothetical protein
MNKLHQLEVRRLLKELDYVKSDFEYKNEIVFEADNSFMRSLNDFLERNPVLKEMFDKKINRRIDEMIRERSTEKVIESIPETMEEEESVEASIVDRMVDEKLKKIYRGIAKLTHPDRISDSRLNDLYIMASKMYETNDVLGIYSICDQLGIPYELSTEDGEILKSQISMMKERVGFMESTFTWKWYHTENENEKSHILVEYIKSKII